MQRMFFKEAGVDARPVVWYLRFDLHNGAMYVDQYVGQGDIQRKNTFSLEDFWAKGQDKEKSALAAFFSTLIFEG